MNTKILTSLFVLGAGSINAYAFNIALPGTEGFPIITLGTAPVIATYEGNSAGFTNLLFLELNAEGQPGMDGITANDLFIFNNQASPVGSTLNLGTFTPGTELVFRLNVTNTRQNFFSGSPSRNPDGLPHARVQANFLPGITLVSFEDLLNTPEGSRGFNDLSFTFSNTTSSSVPDGGSTALSLGLAMSGLVLIAGRRKKMFRHS